MNQANITAIVGTIAAVILGVLQATQGVKIDDNHEMTHDRIDGVEKETMGRETIDVYMKNFRQWQKTQDRRLEEIERGHDLHIHLDDEILDIEETK